jgi:hypothetical protein
MNANFKPLGLAAAVAAATAGYAGVANAQTVAANQLGDMAIVPYYTVQDDLVTGVHIINTSDRTQVVKLRLRRASDSLDALDFNLIMSPKDEWAGFISDDADGTITFQTQDNTCTAPLVTGGTFTMPDLYRTGADEGYLEVIGMGSPIDETQPIAVAALHDSDGVPADCGLVAENFFQNLTAANLATTGNAAAIGVRSSTMTNQTGTSGMDLSMYDDTENVLKVSFFVRDATSGVEFGSNATHIADFMADASITNQEFGIFSADFQGFDWPDLNGGAPLSSIGLSLGASQGAYAPLRTAIGADAVINDWSANQSEAGFTVGTDWVITVPGQYAMMDLLGYLTSLLDPDVDCDGSATAIDCDNRDIPLTATFTVWDREEQGIVGASGELVVSPSVPGIIPRTLLNQEVNVIEWGVAPVLNSDPDEVVTVSVPSAATAGWASLAVVASTAKTQGICAYTLDPSAPVACAATTTPVPLVGFVAWERSFEGNPDANYGRIIDHSYNVAS